MKAKPRTNTNDNKYMPVVYDDRHCIHTLDDGNRCSRFHLQGKMLCPMHDPETKTAILEDQRNYKSHKEWLETELLKPHDLTTAKGIVQFNSIVIQAVLHKKIDRAQANTVGYLMGTQLQAIRADREERKPEQSIKDLLGDGINIQINMTKEERKAFLTAGSATKMGQVLEHVKEDGRIIDTRKNVDGSFSATIEATPRASRDMPMPAQTIAEAMKHEGIDVTKNEIKEYFGNFLGDESDHTPELIGLTDVFEKGNMPSETYHDFNQELVPHERLQGVLTNRFTCKFCGISVANTRRWENQFCEPRMNQNRDLQTNQIHRMPDK